LVFAPCVTSTDVVPPLIGKPNENVGVGVA